ncbi:hypothetical protein ACJJTC_013205 [Scirpophaga incertulas]
MAGALRRALPLAAALAALAVAAAGARFGDRLAPRVPAPYAPRNAPSPHHYAEPEYEESYEQDYEDPNVTAEEALPETEPPPRRPARTEAHRLEMSTEYFVIPDKSSSSIPPPTPSRPMTSSAKPQKSNVTVVPVVSTISGNLRQESWAVPILALACVSMATLGGFEAFVIWGARRQAPSHRHLLLGQCLLFGLFTCAATAALYATTPTVFTCGAVRFGTGVAYVIVFASLLVKCVFLLSLNGGVYLPAAYQGLLLFFAVMIQVAIGAQWLGGSPPRVIASGARCDAQLSDLLLSLCYAAFLITVVCGWRCVHVVSATTTARRHISRGASGATAAVWVCWGGSSAGRTRAAPRCLRGRRTTGHMRSRIRTHLAGRRRLGLLALLLPLQAGQVWHGCPGRRRCLCRRPALDRKEPPAQPADPYRAIFGSSLHTHSRPYCSPQHYPLHPFMHYHYNYSPYQYLLPQGVMVRPEEGKRPLHVGMMY